MSEVRPAAPPKPLPEAIAFEAPYWEAARRGELTLQRCVGYDVFLHPPQLSAPHWCPGAKLEWVTFGSDIVGTLYTFTIVHRAFNKAFLDDAPYAIAMCDIAQAPGARVMANVIGIPLDDIRIGMPLRMVWQPRGDDYMMPQWGPA